MHLPVSKKERLEVGMYRNDTQDFKIMSRIDMKAQTIVILICCENIEYCNIQAIFSHQEKTIYLKHIEIQNTHTNTKQQINSTYYTALYRNFFFLNACSASRIAIV